MEKLIKYLMDCKIIIFLLILSIGIFFRIYALNSVPPQPSLDEASIGYNAYSIMRTGADEYGNKYPILLRAYDDWRPALYVYMVIPFVKILGLNASAVRLPSVILSILSMGAMYFLMKRILLNSKFDSPAGGRNSKPSFAEASPFVKTTEDKSEGQSKYINSNKINGKWQMEIIALITTAIMAISPWHIYISRLGHEVNAALSFFIFGCVFFFYSIKGKEIRNKLFIYLSVLFFALSFDTYQSTKIVVPLFALLLITLYFKQLRSSIKQLLLPLVMGLLLILPIAIVSLQPNAMIRAEATSIFSIPPSESMINAQKLFTYKKNNDYINYFLMNRRIYPLTRFTNSLYSHFNFQWLTVNHGNYGREEFKVPGFGLIYSFEILLIISGLIVILFKQSRRLLLLVTAWLLIAIMPSALSIAAPHPMRAFVLISVFPLIEGFGLLGILYLAKNTKVIYYSLFIIIVTIILINILLFYKAYFHDFKNYNSDQFQYGILETFAYTEKISANYDSVIISNRDNLRASYMYYLFYSQYDPAVYLKSGGSVSGWFDTEHIIGKYHFTDPYLYIPKDKTLIASTAHKMPQGYSILDKIYYLDGREAIWIGEKN